MNNTDWERVASMSESEVYQNALDDPDNLPLTEEQISRAVRIRKIPGNTLAEKREYLKKKHYKKLESINLDAGIIDYFQA